MSHIVIGISSGIAAYKIEDLIIQLKKNGHDIQVIMTQNAVHLISPGKVEELTGHKVFLNLFEKNFVPEKILDRRKVDHIEIAKRADLFVIAPATANTTAKMASGLADDFLTTALLATTAPVLVCPSMNTNMWYHPATQRNLQLIQSYGYEILEPESGTLACGTHGIGRLPSIPMIVTKIEELLAQKKLLHGKKVVVTSGGTIEPIDDARVITNRSSGKMGKALAEAAYRAGADVTLIHAGHAVVSNLPINRISFHSSNDLSTILENELSDADILFHAAAVSDFTVRQSAGKIESSQAFDLHLVPAEKIIDKVKKWNKNILLIGFKAVSVPFNKKNVIKLFQNAHADYVIVNDISRPDTGFESDTNEVLIVDKNGKTKKIAKAAKGKIAEEIIQFICS